MSDLSAKEINFNAPVENVNPNATTVTTNNIFLSETNSSGTDTPLPQSKEYYHLFVMGIEQFPKVGYYHFNVQPKDALTIYISEETKEKYQHLTPDVIPELKSFPALFMQENHGPDYGQAAPEQYVSKGVVTNISVTDNGIRIDCALTGCFPQQLINQYSDEFAVVTRGATKRFSEINSTHWTIKRMNLELILQECGISLCV
ncbi:MAG TPA: hypothetical protein PL161_12000 [Spirochaetota bacterium]|jgi:hypothetical protein|nr:hypothetical protein [Spirochaetota bacterium]